MLVGVRSSYYLRIGYINKPKDGSLDVKSLVIAFVLSPYDRVLKTDPLFGRMQSYKAIAAMTLTVIVGHAPTLLLPSPNRTSDDICPFGFSRYCTI